MPIHLRFGDEVSNVTRQRISYAFRVFAAIYDHPVIEETSTVWEGFSCYYGKERPEECKSRSLFVPARYQATQWLKARPKLTEHLYGGERFYLLYGTDEATGAPDWLGEIFEWLSCSHETGIAQRDGVGRVPYSEMIFGRQNISPHKPHALLLMAWMESALRAGQFKTDLPRAPSPLAEFEHFVVCSHDIDFYYADRRSAFIRLIKNLGIAYHPYRSWSYFLANSRMLLELVGGRRVGDYLPRLLEASAQNGFTSSLFVVVPERGHRRDPNYRLEHLAPHLATASGKGFAVDLHGSYTSVIESAELSSEAAELEKVLEKKPAGNRQHWLRFDQPENLFRCVANAHLKFDSTLGFSDMVGFRNGASFAFPPYDFTNEKPFEFLEIPLALMDGSLEAASRSLRADPQDIADEVLQESRKWGWGGIAALWHNPIEPLSVPAEINRVFWNCVKAQERFREKWLSAEEFLIACLRRYQSAGLLKSVNLDD